MYLTYRAVGSTTGIAEFEAGFSNPNLQLVFASGDIPIPTNVYNAINSGDSNNKQFIHLPVLAGAVSFFHSVPDTPNLNLTACLLAQIYTQNITSWGDPQITAINPKMGMKIPPTNNPMALIESETATALRPPKTA